MIRFKEFQPIHEGKYPMLLKFVTGRLGIRCRMLSNQNKSKTDPVKQNKIIS